jgi:hypothetical protein
MLEKQTKTEKASDKVQRKGLVYGPSAERYKDRLKELVLTTMKDRRHRLDEQKTYNMQYGREKATKDSLFGTASDGERRRQAAEYRSLDH